MLKNYTILNFVAPKNKFTKFVIFPDFRQKTFDFHLLGGPFADIAHGCNSVIAITTALELTDYVVTGVGFGADLRAGNFFGIKCREAGLKPDATVIVATARALNIRLDDQDRIERPF